MKKLKLKLSGARGMLSKEQMKMIGGGYSGTFGSCNAYAWCSIVYEVTCDISGPGAKCQGQDGIGVVCLTDEDSISYYCPL